MSAIIKELPFITLDKLVKYYGVSYTGTSIDFGCKYSGKQVASLVRGSIMSTKGTPSPHQLRCCKINAGCACSFVGCYRESTSVGAGPRWVLCDQDVSSQDFAVLAVVDFKGKSTTCSASWTGMSSSCGKKCGPKRGPF